MHRAATSTWRNIGGVEKNSRFTPQQKQKNVAFAKRSRILLLSCENPKTESPTQRQKKVVLSQPDAAKPYNRPRLRCFGVNYG
jgi:hypothetical protein